MLKAEKAVPPEKVVAEEKAVEAEVEKLNKSDAPTEAEDFNIKDLENYLLKIL